MSSIYGARISVIRPMKKVKPRRPIAMKIVNSFNTIFPANSIVLFLKSMSKYEISVHEMQTVQTKTIERDWN